MPYGRGKTECNDPGCCGDSGERIHWNPFETCDAILDDNYFDNCWTVIEDAKAALENLLS